jgi:hypothetical protein
VKRDFLILRGGIEPRGVVVTRQNQGQSIVYVGKQFIWLSGQIVQVSSVPSDPWQRFHKPANANIALSPTSKH